MQILDIPTIQSKEHTIETFLISTKGNDANWKIDKETGHEKVKSFIGKDFSIIPELLFRPLEQGGGGHVFSDRDTVLSTYAKNSHGKIVELKGPFYDGNDYHYNAIVKLNDSRAASALLEHGNNTWVPFAVSPHIFINEEGGGNDEVGWKDWQGAALALVIKGAYGNEAVISKLCNGPHKACKMELMQRSAGINQNFTDGQTAFHISSIVSKSASVDSLHDMVDTKLSTEPPSKEPAPEGEKPNGGGEGSDQQQQMKIIKDTEVIKPVEQINISSDELAQLRETQKQFKEMQNERRDEILKEIFAGVEDEAARKELIKEYSQKNDLNATKALKAFYDKVSPLVANSTRKTIEMELQQRKEEEAKKTKVNSNGRSASVSLRPEPKVEQTTEDRTASSSKVDEVALLKKFMQSNNGGNLF